LYEHYGTPDRIKQAMQYKPLSTLVEAGGILSTGMGAAKRLSKLGRAGKANRATKLLGELQKAADLPAATTTGIMAKMAKGTYTSLIERAKDSGKLDTVRKALGGPAADFMRNVGSVLTKSDVYKATKKHLIEWKDFSRKHNERLKGYSFSTRLQNSTRLVTKQVR